jgi:hypothetical protein
MPPVDKLSQIRAVYWNPERNEGTCAVCTTPVEPTYRNCFRCNQHAAAGYNIADVVAPLSYAVADQQAMYDLYRYKDLGQGPTARDAQTRLFTMLFATLELHLPCIAAQSEGEVVVTTVPSSGGRSGAHPLSNALGMFRLFDTTEMIYRGPRGLDRQERRVLDPTRFLADSAAVQGRHVLLLDDTWVTGSHLQSCAAALHDAGATWVTGMPLGRMLEGRFSQTAAFLRSAERRPFDPSVCPLTGYRHSQELKD